MLYRLQENFRCGSSITDAANRLMRHQLGRPDKQTISATGKTGEVRIMADGFETDDQEAHAVAEDILHHVNKARHVEDFVTPNDCAVLVRTNHIADYFRNVLKAHGLPVKEKPKTDLPTDWARAKAALALLANPDCDRIAFHAIALASGRQKAEEVRARALENYQTINDAALFLPSNVLVRESLDHLAKMNISREALERIRRIAEVLPTDSPVANLVLAVGREAVDEMEGDGIRVSTLHGSKGTEAEAVWIPAVEDGLFPCPNEEVEESRRLLFVGCTRSRSFLWLSWAKKRTVQWKGQVERQPSRFLSELEIDKSK